MPPFTRRRFESVGFVAELDTQLMRRARTALAHMQELGPARAQTSRDWCVGEHGDAGSYVVENDVVKYALDAFLL